MLCTHGMPQIFNHVFCNAAASSCGQQHTQRLSICAVVAIIGAGRHLPRQGGGELIHRTTQSKNPGKAINIGLRVAIVLIPRGARRHLQNILDCNIVIGRACQLRRIVGDRVINIADVTLLNRYAN